MSSLLSTRMFLTYLQNVPSTFFVHSMYLSNTHDYLNCIEYLVTSALQSTIVEYNFSKYCNM